MEQRFLQHLTDEQLSERLRQIQAIYDRTWEGNIYARNWQLTAMRQTREEMELRNA